MAPVTSLEKSKQLTCSHPTKLQFHALMRNLRNLFYVISICLYQR